MALSMAIPLDSLSRLLKRRMMCGDNNEARTDYAQATTLIPVNNNVLLFRLLDIFLFILIDRLGAV